ncbi:CopD family protein [Sulfitobacter albidus]|uniref:CopD family protein n=1 Tax=Sulfitobacter albidus TaxID=2829501 RepID=A0A975JHD1_9RHOB|nr:CopD family protein [Sulfitobacter albidus]QUJ78221.1 CopD family protein [Sulfitobacter albidus]
MSGLAPIDTITVLAIVAKAAGTGAALLAMGSVLFTVIFASYADASVLRLARRIAIGAAVAGLVVLALRFGIRAARISGMGFEGAVDPMMLGFVWQSPLGDAAIWRGLGEVSVLAVLIPGLGRWIAVAGSFAIAGSFAQIGHSLGDPRGALAIALVIHILAAALWIGALAPLHRAVGVARGAGLLHHFGKVALYGVAVLVATGFALAWMLVGTLLALVSTAYGLGLLVKVLIVCGLLGIAALNKLWLVPALGAGRPGAKRALRRSISVEMIAVVLILLATASLTTVTTPPVNL